MDTNKNTAVKSNLQLFGSTKVMVVSALLIALSIIFGKFLKIPIGDSLRISFENTPILMAGIFFGPIVGMAVGVCADIIGCFLYVLFQSIAVFFPCSLPRNMFSPIVM